MARTGAVVGVVALLALGGWAALPDDEPEYLGDMPSIMEQATATPPLPTRMVPPPPEPPPPPVDGPDPVEQEPPPVIPPAPGDRVPAPITDSPPVGGAGTSDNGDGAPDTGLLDFLEGLDGALPCVDTTTVFHPGLGVIDCVTGLLLEPDPDLDVHPCSLVPLPVVCAGPVPPLPLPEPPLG
jgi:hypothetical protein